MRAEKRSPDFGAIFDALVKFEFEDRHLRALMGTMTAQPYVHYVSTMIGEIGREAVYESHKTHVVRKTPADTQVRRLSRTVDKHQLVNELILSFTPDTRGRVHAPRGPADRPVHRTSARRRRVRP